VSAFAYYCSYMPRRPSYMPRRPSYMPRRPSYMPRRPSNSVFGCFLLLMRSLYRVSRVIFAYYCGYLLAVFGEGKSTAVGHTFTSLCGTFACPVMHGQVIAVLHFIQRTRRSMPGIEPTMLGPTVRHIKPLDHARPRSRSTLETRS
jgi:hypothetical protein